MRARAGGEVEEGIEESRATHAARAAWVGGRNGWQWVIILVVSSQFIKVFKFFSSKLYKIRVRFF